MKLRVLQLRPLMTASERWRATSIENTYYVQVVNGHGVFSENKEGAYAEIKTCPDLSLLPDNVEKPTYYVEWPSGKYAFYVPDSWEYDSPFEGRPYCVEGRLIWNCYSLCQHYYKKTYDIVLPVFDANLSNIQDEFVISHFDHNEELQDNWELVLDPQVGDAVFFAVGKPAFEKQAPNHCGVYLGDSKLLHHFVGRYSCIDNFEAWDEWSVTYLRNKNV